MSRLLPVCGFIAMLALGVALAYVTWGSHDRCFTKNSIRYGQCQ